MNSIPRLITTRLILKAHTLANLERMNAWFNDATLQYYDDDDPPLEAPQSLEKTRVILERMMSRTLEDGILHYGIHKRGSGEFIGYGMIAHIDQYNRRCDLGLTLGEKQEWGQGYGHETLQAVIEYCFTDLGLNRVGAALYEFNRRSQRLFEGLGFTREGVLRQYVVKDGTFKDEWHYSLLRAEWLGSVRRKTDHRA